MSITPDKILLYIQSNEEVFEIPTRMHNNNQYVCLNYHDYGQIDFSKTAFAEVNPGFEPTGKPFSYVIKKRPDFSSQRYLTKEIDFDYYQRAYQFKVLVNPESDSAQFGKEKRLSAEQTLLYDYSDCEDRSAFFFYLVKEIYDLPMIVLTYPKHVTVAVNFGKKLGKNAIEYKGGFYYVCEPSSQSVELQIGEMLPDWRNEAYQVVYEYKTK